MSLISRICGSLESRLSQPHLNIWRTVYFNFRTLPFSQAIKLPVFIYGKFRFVLNGNVEFRNCPITCGMVKIGKISDCFNQNEKTGFLQLASQNSRFVFYGKAKIGVNAKIRAVEGTVYFGNEAFFGSNVRIIANGAGINIGYHSRIAFETNIINSGFHYVYNSAKGCYGNSNRDIIIGAYNWIGNRSTISAGAITKDYTIVCSNSLVGKDYSSIEAEYPMIAGIPAKLIASGMKRVFSPVTHMKIFEYFQSHPKAAYYKTDELIDDINDLSNEF